MRATGKPPGRRGDRLQGSAIPLLAFLLAVGGCTWKGGVAEDLAGTAGELPCLSLLERSHGDTAALEAELWQRVQSFQVSAEILTAGRTEAIRLSRQAVAEAGPDAALSPRLMHDLRRAMGETVAAVPAVERVVAANLCWVDLDHAHAARHGLAALPPAVRLGGVMLALAASLALYDAYLATAAVLNDDKRLRRFLDSGDAGYGMEQDRLHALTVEMTSLTNQDQVRKQIEFYDSNRAGAQELARANLGAAYLMLFMDQSPSLPKLRETEDGDALEARLDEKAHRLRDNFRRLRSTAAGGLSQVFGNTAGLFEARPGRLKDDASLPAALRTRLRPGDILIEKTPFRLTDKLIPGYFGHVALWLGTEEDLRALGVWEDPLVQPYHRDLRQERLVLEALRDGVQLNTLSQFLNVDDLGVLREPGLQDQRLRDHIVRAFRQIGKRYDFNFDVETPDRIACAELVYLVYTDISWMPDRRLGRYTFSPDRVAERAAEGSGLEVVLLYLNGEPVTGDPRGALLERLQYQDPGTPPVTAHPDR